MFFVILAVVLFLLGLALSIIGGVSKEWTEALLFGGLASFAASHVPS